MHSAVIIGHQNSADCDVVAAELSRQQLSVTIVDRSNGTFGPDCLKTDLTVHLGSDFSVVSGTVTPRMKSEYEVMKARYQQGKPVLGVCFGAQMMALALGGRVVRSKSPEFGFMEVVSEKYPSILGGRWFQWHYDEVEVPSNVDIVASNEYAIQAIQKDRFFGVQFHPEVNEGVLLSWLRDGGNEELGSLLIDPNRLLDDLRSGVQENQLRFQEFMQFVTNKLL